MLKSFVGGFIAMAAGASLAAATVVGVVSNQTKDPAQSPGDSQSPAVDYGSTQ